MNDIIANHWFNLLLIMIFKSDNQHYIDFLKQSFEFEISLHIDNVLRINFDVDYVLKKWIIRLNDRNFIVCFTKWYLHNFNAIVIRRQKQFKSFKFVPFDKRFNYFIASIFGLNNKKSIYDRFSIRFHIMWHCKIRRNMFNYLSQTFC